MISSLPRRLCAILALLRLVAFGPPVSRAQSLTGSVAASPAYFTDRATKAGLTATNIFGGKDTKKYIIETTGTGAAIFDFDNDGWPDIFIVNGTTLNKPAAGEAPSNHLYRNNHDGTFSDVTRQ